VRNIGTTSWLPSCRQLNALPTNVHIDWNSSVNQNLVHHGSTFGKETATVFSSYGNFAEKICQIGPEQHHRFIQQQLEVDSSNVDETIYLQDLSKYASSQMMVQVGNMQRLQIALAMISKNCPLVCMYKPSHLIFGRVCMVRQSRAFDLSPPPISSSPSNCTGSSSSSNITEIPIEDVLVHNPCHVIVREIVFGQNSDPDCPPTSLWFGIPEGDITTCDLRDELKQNRKKTAQQRRKRIGTKEQHGGVLTTKHNASLHSPAAASSVFGSGNDPLHLYHMSHRAFTLFYPQDQEVHDLIRNVMVLEIEKMNRHGRNLSLASFPGAVLSPPQNKDASSNQVQHGDLAALEVKELVLNEKIETLGRIFLDSSMWPVNQGREYVSCSTPIPSAESAYCTPPHNTFQNALWSSFVNNLCDAADDDHHNRAVAVMPAHTVMGDRALVLQQRSDKEEEANTLRKKRLPVFEHLLMKTLGVVVPVTTTTTAVNKYGITQNPCRSAMFLISSSPSASSSASFFRDFEAQWKLVREFYDLKNKVKENGDNSAACNNSSGVLVAAGSLNNSSGWNDESNNLFLG
jgi:hypothetical protein